MMNLESLLRGGVDLATFDLLQEPWIPVEDLQGRRQCLGIRELLLHAHCLRRVVDPSPLLTYGIQRMLIVLLMDAYRPKLRDDLSALLALGHLNEDMLSIYWSDCIQDWNCFDLFDEKRPFLQSVYDGRWDEEKKIKPVALLLHEVPTGNNHVHFDHRYENGIGLSPAVCAKALCALSVFCTAGLQGSSSINGAPPIYVLHNGVTLFETLVCSMMARREYEAVPYDDPPPAWHANVTVEPDLPIAATSVLYGMTWQARRVLLIADKRGGICNQTGEHCPVIVREMYFQKGLKFEGYGTWTDPHVAYIIRKEARLSLKPQEGRAPWRDIGTIMLDPGKSKNHHQPVVVNHQAEVLCDAGLDRTLNSTQVFGLVTNQAQYGSWMQGDIEMDRRIVASEDRSLAVQEALRLAELAALEVRKRLAEVLGGTKHADLLEQCVSGYFHKLREAFFGRFCPMVSTADIELYGWQIPIQSFWKETVKSYVIEAFLIGCKRLGNNARHFEQSAKTELNLRKSINKLLKEGD